MIIDTYYAIHGPLNIKYILVTLVPFSLPLGLQISFKSSEHNMQTLLTSHQLTMRIQPVVFSFI